MTVIDVRYTEYDTKIESVKIPINEDVYKIIKPTIEENIEDEETIVSKYIEFEIHDESLNNVIAQKLSKDEVSRYIRILQRLLREN